MQVGNLALEDYRSYRQVEIDVPAGLTVFVGKNGQGKTNLFEAIAFVATRRSFRAAPKEALVRRGTDAAYIHARTEIDGRSFDVDAEIRRMGPQRIKVNGQPVQRLRDLAEALRVTVFSPDDLCLVKEGPAHRREWLDSTLVQTHPKYEALTAEVNRVLKHRNALLKQVGRSLTTEERATLDVWNDKLTSSGEALTAARIKLLEHSLAGRVTSAYKVVADGTSTAAARYGSSWLRKGLGVALAESEPDDLRRGISLVGPHRDDVTLTIDEMPARTQASQGEQRSLAVAMRLASHEAATAATGSAPVLLLDDIFSELDHDRGEALFDALPDGQTFITTATELPSGASPDAVFRIENATVSQ